MVKTSLILTLIFLLITLILLNQPKPADAKLNKTELINQFLNGHNAARKEVGVPPLKWLDLLAKYSRIYSTKNRRKDCKLIHSPGTTFGENLFWGQGKNWYPKDAVAAWVAEKQWYNYRNNSCSGDEECGHYTQVVWRDTKLVGCAMIKCDTGDIFITCEYYPPGNYDGEKPY
ncbi:hypothetical protein RND81_03G107900 [Saponaria officinalis]|uniref:SCP domain-containing protein n=1 Tax=Saponaria officinalis TaxID=3572 RepID=A0AAW1M9M3_SAPOF